MQPTTRASDVEKMQSNVGRILIGVAGVVLIGLVGFMIPGLLTPTTYRLAPQSSGTLSVDLPERWPVTWQADSSVRSQSKTKDTTIEVAAVPWLRPRLEAEGPEQVLRESLSQLGATQSIAVVHVEPDGTRVPCAVSHGPVRLRLENDGERDPSDGEERSGVVSAMCLLTDGELLSATFAGPTQDWERAGPELLTAILRSARGFETVPDLQCARPDLTPEARERLSCPGS